MVDAVLRFIGNIILAIAKFIGANDFYCNNVFDPKSVAWNAIYVLGALVILNEVRAKLTEKSK